MTKADWIQGVKKSLFVPQKEATYLVEIALELIKMALERGEKVKISGFGSFVVQEKKERIGRNPQTGEPIVIAARRVLAFKPSAVLKKKLNS
jgi:integration host factor subunit alpha